MTLSGSLKQSTQYIGLLFLLLALPIATLTLSSESRAESATIESISFEGVRAADTTTLRKTLASREGAPYREDAIQEDIVRLFKLGLFQDIQVEKTAGTRGIKLIYHMTEKPTVAHVIFKSNKKIKTDKLEEVSKVRTYALFNEEQIVDTVEAIRKLYTDKGYYLADVRHELVPSDKEKNQWDLVFHIDENQEVRIQRISFVGNNVFADDELKKAIRTKEKGFLGFITRKNGKYAKENLEQDTLMLTAHYLVAGYLKVKVSPPQVYLSRDKSELYVTFTVQEGNLYHVSATDVAGDVLTTRAELLSQIKLKKGDVANRRFIEDDIRRLTEFYGNRGYAFANVYPAIMPDDETKTATVTYQIEKGQQVTIEKIIIKGNTITRDKVIRRELRIAENAIFNQSDLELSRRKIDQLGYFKEVNISTPRGSSDDKVNVVIEVKERQTGSFSIGGGFSTAEKFLVTASVQKDNFLGYGISSSLSLELSARRQQLYFSFVNPYFLDTRWILSANAYRRLYAFNDFKQSSYGGGFSLGHPFFTFWNAFMGYRMEKVNIVDIDPIVPDLFRNTLSSLTNSVYFTMNRDTRNNRLFPTQGSFFSNTVTYSGLGGGTNLFKEEFNARYYQPVVWKTVLRANGAFGYIDSLNNQPIPLFERFYLGGVNSLRGYDIKSIGPKIRSTTTLTGPDADFVYGGNKFLLFNVEYEIPLYDPAGIHAVVFFDAGNAYGEDETLSLNKLRLDYGAGIRWVSPFGPMRFEWGIPIDRKEGEDPWVFNFTIGSFF